MRAAEAARAMEGAAEGSAGTQGAAAGAAAGGAAADGRAAGWRLGGGSAGRLGGGPPSPVEAVRRGAGRGSNPGGGAPATRAREDETRAAEAGDEGMGHARRTRDVIETRCASGYCYPGDRTRCATPISERSLNRSASTPRGELLPSRRCSGAASHCVAAMSRISRALAESGCRKVVGGSKGRSGCWRTCAEGVGGRTAEYRLRQQRPQK